jgi:hypothetical protein
MGTVQRFISTGSAVLVASVGTGAMLLGTTVAGPAAAATTHLVPNPSFEQVTSGQPTCWQQGGSGTGTASFTTTSTAHAGSLAGQLSVAQLDSGGNRKVVISQKTAGCAPAVSPGHSYALGAYFQADAPVLLSVYYRDSAGTWRWWTQSSWFPASSGWAQATYTTPAVPSGATALSFGPSVSTTGTLEVDDVTMTDAGVTGSGGSYDNAVLADGPVAYWGMTHPGTAETDLAGNDHSGSYVNGTPSLTTMPNGDSAADFSGRQYMMVPSAGDLSIANSAHQLTWEAWIRPDTLQFPSGTDGYTDFLGKCGQYYHSCEYESRMYNSVNSQNRCNRLSAYVFNLHPTSAGLGSAADWQPKCNMLAAGHWYHVVGEYRTDATPYSICRTAYPGTIDIWVNGVKWYQAAHNDTGCMSQYSIVPQAGPSPFVVGTLAQYDYFFTGAIGKVAVYDKLLSPAQISAHYAAMTARQPSGSCSDTCTLTNP